MREKNHLGIMILTIAFVCFGTLFPRMITFAGGINGNEARVISAASGTFTYNGKTYRAGSAYINSLVSYLSEDDVDLTSEQADEAISTMYASVADGIEQGYLYEVGAEDTTENASTETTEETATTEEEQSDEKEDGSGKKNDKTDSNSKNSSAEKEDGSSTDVNVWDTMSNPTENKNKLKKRPKKENASAAIEMEDEAIVVTTKDKEAISIPKTEPIIPNGYIIAIAVFSGILFTITVVCGAILFGTKCMSFRKPKSRKARPGHSKRRKIRHNTRAVLTVTTGISVLIAFLMLGIYISLFNQDAIMQNMQDSGYFRYAYSEYIADTADSVLQGSVDEMKENLKDTKIATYEEYSFTIKQNSLKVLGGNLDVVIPDSNVAPYVYNLKTSFVKLFQMSGFFVIGSIIFGVILMIFMDQRRERGVKHIAASVLAAGAVMAVFTLVMTINKPYMHIYIEPDYLYLFLMECVKRLVAVMTSITAFGVVLGMLLVGVFKTIAGSRS